MQKTMISFVHAPSASNGKVLDIVCQITKTNKQASKKACRNRQRVHGKYLAKSDAFLMLFIYDKSRCGAKTFTMFPLDNAIIRIFSLTIF